MHEVCIAKINLQTRSYLATDSMGLSPFTFTQRAPENAILYVQRSKLGMYPTA